MRVFVTGVNGFIGRAVAERLRSEGHQVRGVDLAAGPHPDVVAGDVSSPGHWQEHAEGCELVIHTAAIVSNTASIDAAWRVNTVGTRNVLDASVRGGAGRFLYLSSIRAFSDLGFPDQVTEVHPVRPDGNPYVDTRIACEQVVLQAHAAGEIDCTVVRPGDVYGPGSRPWTVLPIELIKANRFFLPAMGRGRFSPVYVDDLVAGVLLAGTHPEAAGQVFTLAGGVTVSTKEFFGHYYRMLGKRGPMVVPTPVALVGAQLSWQAGRLLRRPTEVNPTAAHYLARTGGYSIEKARRLLGYHPEIRLEDGMRRTQRWLVSEGLVPA